MRLIDADALKWIISNNVYKVRDRFGSEDYGMFWIGGIQMVIDAAPTIDAVPVVRCKDCVNFERDDAEGIEDWFAGCGVRAEEDGYCAWGERKAEP